MNTNISTTRSQSERLLRCGVSAATADMRWWGNAPDAISCELIHPQWLLESETKNKEFSLFSLDLFPAWSLSALLALMPKQIEIDGYPYRIAIYFENPDEPVIGNQWCLYYKPKKHTEKSRIDDVPMYAPDLIECAVLMTEWLIANGYKLNEKKNRR